MFLLSSWGETNSLIKKDGKEYVKEKEQIASQATQFDDDKKTFLLRKLIKIQKFPKTVRKSKLPKFPCW